MSNNTKKYKLKLYPLTPIHVGTGETISPGEYMMNKALVKVGDNDELYYDIQVGDLAESVVACNKTKEVIKLLETNNKWLKEVYKYTDVLEHFKTNRDYRIFTRSKDIFNEIRKKFFRDNKDAKDNKADLLINTMFRNLTGVYVPGSSIKGSMRTAVLYSKLSEYFGELNVKEDIDNKYFKNLPDKKIDYTKLEIMLMNDFKKKQVKDRYVSMSSVEDDPFKDFKVSDTLGQKGSSRLYKTEFVNMEGIIDYRETTNYSFENKVSLDFFLNLGNFFDIENVLSDINYFYKDNVLEYEKSYWENMGNEKDKNGQLIYRDISNGMLKTYKKIEEVSNKDNMYLIRIGWGIGLNSMSFNLLKIEGDSPNPYKPKGKKVSIIDKNYYAETVSKHYFKDYTITKDKNNNYLLEVSNYLPLGWALIKVEDEIKL